MIVDDILIELDKKIKRLEERDPEYEKNPKWQELRRKQDIAFINLAQRKLNYHKKIFILTKNQTNAKFVEIYEDYINGKS